MRRSVRPWNVSTYVRTEVSAIASSTVGPPSRLAQRILKAVRFDSAPIASGVYMSIQTHFDELVDGTNRNDGEKSTDVTPFTRLTSACTLSDVCNGAQG